jgi:competence protein ComEC
MKAITSPGACRAARLICVFLSFLLLTLAPVFATAQPTMRVHFINVGQGAASLLEFSCGAVLIDAGGEENDEVHSGDDLMAYLDAFFARRTDLKRRLSSFMLTHPHKDHTAGVEKVVAAFKPRNAVTNGQYYGSGKKGQLALREYSWGRDRREGTSDDVPYQWVRLEDLPAEHGYSDAIVDPVKCADIDPVITILWGQVTTPRDWGYSFGKPRYANSNNHSLAIRVRFGQSSILWTGDMEEVAIEEFVARYRNTTELDVDVYEAGHHGSRNGTTRALLEAMTPTISVISMGTIDQEVQWTAWDYGHPNQDVVELLQQFAQGSRPPFTVPVGIGKQDFTTAQIARTVYATAWDGDIVLEADDQGHWSVSSLANSGTRVDLNSATVAQLADLPGLGPKKAAAIVDFIRQRGPISSIRDLDKVRGIGPATLALIEPHVTFGSR